MKFTRLLLLTVLLTGLLPLLSACSEPTEPSLPLETYLEPNGLYSLSVPEGWELDQEEHILTLTPPRNDADTDSLRLLVFVKPAREQEAEAHARETQELLEPFLRQYIDDSYEIINEGETKAGKLPAVVIDFAKPEGSAYLVGREVLAAEPNYVVAFLGLGERQQWEDFLPTFRKMLTTFQLSGAIGMIPTP